MQTTLLNHAVKPSLKLTPMVATKEFMTEDLSLTPDDMLITEDGDLSALKFFLHITKNLKDLDYLSCCSNQNIPHFS